MEYRKEPVDREAEVETIRNRIENIANSVRARGDDAIAEFTERFDDAQRETVTLTEAEKEAAFSQISEKEKQIVNHNTHRIRKFAERQLESVSSFEENFGSDVVMGQTLHPVESVGAYVPGGRYPLLSSALMTVIPAAVAGVDDIAVASPPASNDTPHPATVYGAFQAGADRLHVVGGAQAITGLAYGTESIDSVDKIVGPGNVYTTEAKRHVFGQVGLDMLAGPSEILVLADETADVEIVAADLLAQAEHDVHARPLLVATSSELADGVIDEVERQLGFLETKDVAGESWETQGTVIIAQDLDEAVEVTNELAPEHLSVQMANPRSVADSLHNYGSLFLGTESAVVFSDKCVGTNHVLPTGRAARYTGGLSVFDFVKILTHQEIGNRGVEELRPWAVEQSRVEHLDGHAKSVFIRDQDATVDEYDIDVEADISFK